MDPIKEIGWLRSVEILHSELFAEELTRAISHKFRKNEEDLHSTIDRIKAKEFSESSARKVLEDYQRDLFEKYYEVHKGIGCDKSHSSKSRRKKS